MSARSSLIALFALTLLVTSAVDAIAGSVKRSRSDKDINAIGHRKITRDHNSYSPEKERELGKSAAEEFEASRPLLRDPATTDYLQRVAEKIAQNSDAEFPISVQVIDSDDINFYTLPGGYQYVTGGMLLQFDGECELASALARGVAHTALRSATRERTRAEVGNIASVPVTNAGTNSQTKHTVVTPLTLLKFRRQNELDADYFGVQYAYRAGYDPACFPRFIERTWPAIPLQAKSNVETFSPLPPLEQRLTSLGQEIASLPKQDATVISTPEFEAFRFRLRNLRPQVQQPVSSRANTPR